MEHFLVRVCLSWGLTDKNPAVLFAAWKCVLYFPVLLRLRPELFCLKMSDVWHPRAPASWVIITLLAFMPINTTFNKYMCVCAAKISSISGWYPNSGAITCTCIVQQGEWNWNTFVAISTCHLCGHIYKWLLLLCFVEISLVWFIVDVYQKHLWPVW